MKKRDKNIHARHRLILNTNNEATTVRDEMSYAFIVSRTFFLSLSLLLDLALFALSPPPSLFSFFLSSLFTIINMRQVV